jgi:hypothetical protein
MNEGKAKNAGPSSAHSAKEGYRADVRRNQESEDEDPVDGVAGADEEGLLDGGELVSRVAESPDSFFASSFVSPASVLCPFRA